MKKIFTLFVAAIVAVAMYAKTAESGSCGANLTWNFDSGTLTISGTGPMTDYSTDNLAPWFDLSDNITVLHINPGLTTIGDYAFYGLTKVANDVHIPAGVTYIGKYAFDVCVSIPSVFIPVVDSIGAYAFGLCAALNSVFIPYGVNRVGESAFAFCTGLKEVALSSTTGIGQYAFRSCTALERVADYSLYPQSNNGNIFEDVNVGQCELFVPVDEYAQTWYNKGIWNGFRQRIISSNEDMGNGFYHFYDFEEGSMRVAGEGMLPDNVYESMLHPSVTDPRFQVVSLSLPEGLTGIGKYYFGNYWYLDSLTIPEGVSVLKTSAFQNCYSLRTVTIPSSTILIEDYVFADCYPLKTVYNYATAPQSINAGVFDRVNISKCTLYVPKGYKSAYEAAPVWKDFVIEEMEYPEAIEQPTSDSSLKGRANKVLRDGQLFIERNGKTYTTSGAEVK